MVARPAKAQEKAQPRSPAARPVTLRAVEGRDERVLLEPPRRVLGAQWVQLLLGQHPAASPLLSAAVVRT